MAKGVPRATVTPPNGRGEAIPQPPRSQAQPGSEQAQSDILSELAPGQRLYLHRNLPIWASGYCETIQLPEGSSISTLMDSIRDTWGGGEYSIKRFDHSGNWMRGSARIQVFGEPKDRGVLMRPSSGQSVSPAPPAQSAPVVIQAPAAPAPPVAHHADSGVVGSLAGLVSTLANPQSSVSQLLALLEVAERLRGRPQTMPTPTIPTTDPLASLDRTMTLLDRLRGWERRIEREPEVEDEDQMGTILKILERVTGKEAAQTGVPAPPTCPPGTVAGPWVWTGDRWAPNVRPQQARAPTPEPRPPPASEPPPDDDDEWEDAPITADEVADHLASLPEDQQKAFVSSVMERLGVDSGEATPP